MKTVVSINEISEFEIKPKEVLNEWQQMVAREMKDRWNKATVWIKVSCPVCNSDETVQAFSKQNFAYVECTHCKTLYAQTRPSTGELNWWYTESASVKSWQEKLLKLSATSRETKIIEPRSNWILDGLSEYIPNLQLSKLTCTDISFFGKALLEKIGESAEGMKLIAAGITVTNEKYESANVQVKTVSSIGDFSELEKTDVLIAIDVLERIPCISQFLLQAEAVIKPGGLVFATCPVSSGFEIQSLWDRSPAITQPDKLNLPSVKGLMNNIDTLKWEILELSTPGMFDVEIVKRTMQQFPAKDWPRSLHALLDEISQQGVEQFTEYLQSQRLSSFARIVLRRK